MLRRYGLMPALVKEIVIDQALTAIAVTEAEAGEAFEQFLQANQIQEHEQRQAFLQQRGR